MLNKESFEELLSTRMHDEILRTLPQYAVLGPSRMDWLDSLEKDFHGAYWHYKRMFGIGGSEAIACLQTKLATEGFEYRHLNFFRSPFDIFQNKTMAVPVPVATPVMNRGNMFEEGAKKLFLNQINAKDVTQEIVESYFRNIEEYPWMIGNPDLFAQVGEELWLVDIKIPSEFTTEVPLAYIAQLHHYRNISELCNVIPDRMALGVYDFPSGTTKILMVPYEETISEDLKIGGEKLWSMILSGKMPRFEIREKDYAPRYSTNILNTNEVSSRDNEIFRSLQSDYLEKRKEMDDLKSECDSLLSSIKDIVSKYSIKNTLPSGFDFDGLSPRFLAEPDLNRVSQLVSEGIMNPNVLAPKNIDVQGLICAAKENGVDVSPFLSGVQVDSKALQIELKRLGMDSSEVCDFKISLAKSKTMSVNKKPIEKPLL